MKCPLERLPQQLNSKIFKSLYLIIGDEELLRLRAESQISKATKLANYEIQKFSIDKNFNLDVLKQDIYTGSLFSNKKLLLITLLESPSPALQKLINEFAKNPEPDCIICIQSPRLRNAASKWIMNLEKSACLIPIWPIERRQLPQWIQARARQEKLNIQRDAAILLAEQTEGNLLLTEQTIETLALCGQTEISVEAIAKLGNNNSKFDVFALVGSILQADTLRCMKIYHSLRQEKIETNLILWSICQELRLLHKIHKAIVNCPLDQYYKQQKIWPKRQIDLNAGLKNIPAQKCLRLLQQAAKLDQIIKGIKAEDLDLAFAEFILTATTKEKHGQNIKAIN